MGSDFCSIYNTLYTNCLVMWWDVVENMQIFRIPLRETEGYTHLCSYQVEIVTLNKSKNKLMKLNITFSHVFIWWGLTTNRSCKHRHCYCKSGQNELKHFGTEVEWRSRPWEIWNTVVDVPSLVMLVSKSSVG
jgi:hypothetical protein